MVNTSHAQEAPGPLEDVRTLLNTWLIPNDTRRPEDRLDAHAAHLPAERRRELKALRDDLRRAVETPAEAGELLNAWIARLDVRPLVTAGGLGFAHRTGPAGELLGAVLDAIAEGRWRRLKACPDCRWVFYDHSRNASKRWCLMTAGGPGGRSCGSIAKVRAHRERVRAVE